MIQACAVINMHGIDQQAAVHVAKIPYAQQAAVVEKTDFFTIAQIHGYVVVNGLIVYYMNWNNEGIRTHELVGHRHCNIVISCRP